MAGGCRGSVPAKGGAGRRLDWLALRSWLGAKGACAAWVRRADQRAKEA